MQLGSQRVWDYAGDNYVHRLVQNKSDGKLVQVDEGGNPVEHEKLDSLTLEVSKLKNDTSNHEFVELELFSDLRQI